MMTKAGEAVTELLDYDDEALLDQIAMRATEMRFEPQIAGELSATVTIDAEHLGILEDVQELGGRIFKRIEREMFDLLCGDSQGAQADRQSIIEATGLGDAALGAALVAAMTGIGIAPIVATAAAALLIKRVLKPAGGVACEFWGEQLETRS